jgi:predicted nuclease with TOPRIM domain
MSVVAKILIVLNLLLAVVFLGSAATFLGAKETWKKKYNDLNTETTATIEALTADKAALNDRLTIAQGKVAELQAALDSVTSQFETKQEEYAEILKRRNELATEMTALNAEKADLIKQIEQLTARKDQLIDEKDQAQTEKNRAVQAENVAVTEQRRLQDNLNDANDMIAGLEKRIVDMGGQIESLDMRLKVYVEQFGELPEMIAMPALAAKVSAVNNDLNIVVLSIGRDDKVKPGYVFTIYRGTDYVAKVVIDKVDKDFCSGYSRKPVEKAPIQVGDDATTRF